MSKTARLLSLSMTALKSNFVSLHRPYKLNFSITYWCNSHCLTCNIWQLRPKGELSIDEIRSFASKNNYFKWVELTGGEPFMRSDIAEIAGTFVKSMPGLYVLTTPTNSLVNKDTVLNKVEAILNTGIPRFVITLSLDGYRELHDKIRGVPGNYSRVIELAKSLHDLQSRHSNLSFVFGYTISKYNAGMLKRTIEAVHNDLPWLDSNMFHVNIGQVSDAYYKNSGNDFVAAPADIVGDVEYVLGIRKRSADPMQIIEHAFLRKLLVFLKTGRQPMRSRNIEASIFLDSFGDVYPSIMWNEKIGNIRSTDYNLLPVLASSKAAELRRTITEGKEPNSWTSCDAYQTLVGNIKELLL
ncbi:MAG: radical SAM/SPASM domain-containing protein [Candidatus Micrarchaeaceae archaeon]